MSSRLRLLASPVRSLHFVPSTSVVSPVATSVPPPASRPNTKDASSSTSSAPFLTPTTRATPTTSSWAAAPRCASSTRRPKSPSSPRCCPMAPSFTRALATCSRRAMSWPSGIPTTPSSFPMWLVRSPSRMSSRTSPTVSRAMPRPAFRTRSSSRAASVPRILPSTLSTPRATSSRSTTFPWVPTSVLSRVRTSRLVTSW